MMPSAQRSFRTVLLAGTALLALPQIAAAQPAPNARPAGGVVVAGSAADQPGRERHHDRPVEPARRDQLAELRCRRAAERAVPPAGRERGGAQPRRRSQPVADRRPYRRQRPGDPGQPGRHHLLSRRAGQRRRLRRLRRRHGRQGLHGRAHGVHAAGASRRRASSMPARSPSSRPGWPRWWRRRWPIPASSRRSSGMSCWPARGPRRSTCTATGWWRSMSPTR